MESITKIGEMLGAGVTLVLAILITTAWGFGGMVGAIWAAVNDDLLSVVLSIFIPLYGAIYAITQIAG